MKYFLVEMDKDFPVPQMENWYSALNPKLVSQSRYDEIPRSTVIDIKPDIQAFFTDVVSFPYWMITAEAEEILNLYEPLLEFRRIYLVDKLHLKHKAYLLPTLEVVDCLHERTVYNKDHSAVTKPIITCSKTKGKMFFRPLGFPNTAAVMHIDLVESLLRRKIRGLGLTDIELAYE